jgi:AcrR family transcriptional regulator
VSALVIGCGAQEVFMSRSTDPQARQATRDRILRVAAREFAQAGFEQANINLIAEQADIGKGTIYLYFPSKRDLFLAMLQTIAERHLAATRAALSSSPTLAGQLEAFVLVLIRLAVEDADGFHVFLSALYGVNRAFQQEAVRLLRESLTLLRAAVLQGAAGLKLAPGDLEARALFLFSATESLVLSARVLGYSERDLRELTPTLVRLLLQGLASGHISQ